MYSRVVLLPKNAFYKSGVIVSGVEQTFEEWLEAGIHAADPMQRFYPMPEVRGIEDNTEDPTTWTDPYGAEFPLRDGSFRFTQRFHRDSCLNKRLLAFNNQEFRAIIFDNSNNVQVIRTSEGITGAVCDVFVTQPKANTESELSQPTIKYSFLSPDEMKSREIISTEMSWEEFKGLEDIKLNILKDVSNLIITFTVDCSGEDVTGELAPLSGEASAWFRQTGSNAPITMDTAPSYDPVTKTFSVTGISGKIGLANPSVLLGLGVNNKDCSEMVAVPS